MLSWCRGALSDRWTFDRCKNCTLTLQLKWKQQTRIFFRAESILGCIRWENFNQKCNSTVIEIIVNCWYYQGYLNKNNSLSSSNWHISKCIFSRITSLSFSKIPLERYKFTKIAVTSFSVSYLKQNFFQWRYIQLMRIFHCAAHAFNTYLLSTYNNITTNFQFTTTSNHFYFILPTNIYMMKIY